MLQYIELWSHWLVFGLLKWPAGAWWAEAANFFAASTIKIFLLMLIITHLMSLARYYLPIEKLRDFLAKHRLYGLDYLLATLMGAVTPFCSCSSIPLFIGFLEAGIRPGVAIAFLITSPLINEVAVALLAGIFGWKMTGVYVGAGILIGMLGGFLMEKMKMGRFVEDFGLGKTACSAMGKTAKKPGFRQVMIQISREARSIIKRVAPYLLVGIGLGAFIHGYVPEGFFEKYLAAAGIWGVPLAVILGVPMYSSASGVIPIVQSLTGKGVELGTALAFMMAVVGLSWPEAIILKKVFKWPLLGAFFGMVTAGIIAVGYIFNWLLS